MVFLAVVTDNFSLRLQDLYNIHRCEPINQIPRCQREISGSIMANERVEVPTQMIRLNESERLN
jgi:hypothetical protein